MGTLLRPFIFPGMVLFPRLHPLVLVRAAETPPTGNSLLSWWARRELALITTPCDRSCETSPHRPPKPIEHDLHLTLPSGHRAQLYYWHWLTKRRGVYRLQARLNARCSMRSAGRGYASTPSA